MRDSFANSLTKNILKNKNIFLMIGDTGSGLFNKIENKKPKQFLNAGIAEANMVTTACGLSAYGFNVFVYAIGPHIVYRAYEQIRNDVCLNNCNVKIVSIGSGLHYADHGPTHHSTEDFAVLRCLPNMKIYSPSGDSEAEQITNFLCKSKGPAYLRLGRGKDLEIKQKFIPKKANLVKAGSKLTVFATGSSVNEVFELINSDFKNSSIELININTIKPIDQNSIKRSCNKTKKVLVIEEHQKSGGLSEAISSIVLNNNIKVKVFDSIAINDVFCTYSGTYEGIKNKFKISPEDIKKKIKNILNLKS
jgi:transketolase